MLLLQNYAVAMASVASSAIFVLIVDHVLTAGKRDCCPSIEWMSCDLTSFITNGCVTPTGLKWLTQMEIRQCRVTAHIPITTMTIMINELKVHLQMTEMLCLQCHERDSRRKILSNDLLQRPRPLVLGHWILPEKGWKLCHMKYWNLPHFRFVKSWTLLVMLVVP